jgi:hypothetical protein
MKYNGFNQIRSGAGGQGRLEKRYRTFSVWQNGQKAKGRHEKVKMSRTVHGVTITLVEIVLWRSQVTGNWIGHGREVWVFEDQKGRLKPCALVM